MLGRVTRLALLLVVGLLVILPLVAACTTPSFTVVPACTPVAGSTVDPCARLPETLSHGGDSLVDGSRGPGGPEDVFPSDRPVLAAHLVVRGTYLPDTMRCTADGVRRRAPSWREISPLFRDRTAVKCYADVRANEYLVGIGPGTLTVQVVHEWYGLGKHYTRGEPLRAAMETILSEGGGQGHRIVPTGGLAGREVIMFLTPALDVSTEAWWVSSEWDVQRLEGGTVVAVHPSRDIWAAMPSYETYKTKLEVPLAAFNEKIRAAHKTRMTETSGRIGADTDLPMLVTDANRLRDYYVEVGAYDDPDNPPAQPPPAPSS